MNKKVSSITKDSSAVLLYPKLPILIEPIFNIKTFSGPISPISKMLGMVKMKKPKKKPPSTAPPPIPIVSISRETKHRLINDIKDIVRNPLTNHGIYYIHDEENMLQGSALIIGPSDTCLLYTSPSPRD